MTLIAQGPTALTVQGLTKRFGNNRALDDVDLEIVPGRIHALLGMNGSGKSTLVKVLSGYHAPDAGEISVAGRPLRDAHVLFVHQDLGLVESMTVAENLGLGGDLPMRAGIVDRTAERSRARAALAPFGLSHLVDRRMSALRMAERTIIAIARALLQRTEESNLLVLDEPTSALPTAEAQQLLDVMRDCAREGMGLLFVTHRLSEVLSVADDVTVLRSGRVVLHEATAETSLDRIVSSMAGAEVGRLTGTPLGSESDVTASASENPIALQAVELSGDVLQALNLEVREGEIVGVAGLLGSGIEELAPLLSGRAAPASGSVSVSGDRLHKNSQNRVGYVPANRVVQSVLTGLTARENASLPTISSYLRGGALSLQAERNAMKRWFERMTVRPLDTEIGMQQLSGGNQQKVIFARWLAADPAVLIADEPTQGVDVHAKAQILETLRQFAAEGLAVVLISGEPEEIASACDRLVILFEGRVVAEHHAPLDAHAVLAALHTESTS